MKKGLNLWYDAIEKVLIKFPDKFSLNRNFIMVDKESESNFVINLFCRPRIMTIDIGETLKMDISTTYTLNNTIDMQGTPLSKDDIIQGDYKSNDSPIAYYLPLPYVVHELGHLFMLGDLSPSPNNIYPSIMRYNFNNGKLSSYSITGADLLGLEWLVKNYIINTNNQFPTFGCKD